MWAPVLVLALWAAQMLGLVHQTQHHSVLPGAASAATSSIAKHSHGVLAHVFSAHGDLSERVDSKDCRLYDQLAHADACAVVPWVWHTEPKPQPYLAPPEQAWVADTFTHFSARAPPASQLA
ncbi:MAG: hypothetical protein EB072_02640 [Betaproteobacteria bacterium]|nr:hypothetical protein [Betaproteobacteria bacterium]